MGVFVRACEAVHEHPAYEIVHGVRHSFESSCTIRICREFALLAGYFLQGCHQEHPPVCTRAVPVRTSTREAHPSMRKKRKPRRTLVWVHIFFSLCSIVPLLLPFLELIFDGPEIGLQFWVDI